MEQLHTWESLLLTCSVMPLCPCERYHLKRTTSIYTFKVVGVFIIVYEMYIDCTSAKFLEP